MWVVRVLNTDVHCWPVLVAVVVFVFALLFKVRDKPRRGKVTHRPFIKTRGRRPSPRITLLFGNREFPNGLPFTPPNSTSRPQLSFRSSPIKSRYINIPEKCHGNYTWPDVSTSADHSLKQKVPQPKKKKIINEKKIKPRVLFASQSLLEKKQVGSEEDKVKLILQYKPKGRDNGLIEQAKTAGLYETDPPLTSNVEESCQHVHSRGKSIYVSKTKVPLDDGEVSKTRSAAGLLNTTLSPEPKSKVSTIFMPSYATKREKPYQVKWNEQIEQAKAGSLCETDPLLSSNVMDSCEHGCSQGKSISASITKVPPDNGEVSKTRSVAGSVNSKVSPGFKSRVGAICLPVDVTKREKPYQVKWDKHIEQAKTGGLCETDPPLSFSGEENCKHVRSQGKSISTSNLKVPLVNGQVAQNRSTSTGNSALSPELKSKVGTIRLPVDVSKREKPYQVKWDKHIEQAKTGGLCETDPPLSFSGEENCKHVQSQGKSISTSNIKVPLVNGQVAQNRSTSTGNSALSPELKSKVGTIHLPADFTKREKPYQVKWDEQISRASWEQFPHFLTLRDVETNSHVSSGHHSSFATFLPIRGHTCRRGQRWEKLASTTTYTSLCQTLQTDGSFTDKVEHRAPRTSQKIVSSHNGEVEEIELMDLSWDNSDCFSGNSAGSRESSPLELIKEVSGSSDNSIGKSERKMRSSRKKVVKSHKREPVNCHCTNCEPSDKVAHLSKTPSSTEKDGKSSGQEPVTCNHKNSDANDVVAQASKSEVHCILCGITLSKPQCFYSLGSLCTDDDICETTSDDINRHLVSDVDMNPPAAEGKGHPDTGYTSSEEFENESVSPKQVDLILPHKKQGTDGYDGDHESDSSLESLVLTLSSSEDEQKTVSMKEYTKQERTKRQEMAISLTVEKVKKLMAKARAEKSEVVM